MPTTDLRNHTLPELTEFLSAIGLPASRAGQVFNWLWRPGNHDFAHFSGLNRDLRELLPRHATLSHLRADRRETSKDGTVKFCFRLADGAMVESVLIPGPRRRTLCLSSQAGCAMGCRFCLTGGMGLVRNLYPAEIAGQVLAVMEHLVAQGESPARPRELINNLVFMGMGEPLANFDHLRAALAILMAPQGLEFTERRITVSTCGLAPRIRQLKTTAPVNLALSLHAADDQTRSRLMPVNGAYPIAELLAACRDYPRRPGQVILIEYILFAGINDAPEHARRLAEILSGLPCRINLMPFNESEALPFRRPDRPIVEAFQAILRQAGFMALIRNSRGADIQAACGQLASRPPPRAGATFLPEPD